MKPARIVFSVAAAIICAAMFTIISGASFQAQAGVAGDLWNQAASGGKAQTAATVTATPTPQNTAPVEKGSLGKMWDKAASGDKTATNAGQTAQPPDPDGPKEPAEPTHDISDWQRVKFLDIVDILFPPDASRYTDHKNDLLWVVGKYYEYKLFFGAEMVRDPKAKAKSMKVAREDKAVLNGPVGKNWICCFQYDGTMNIGGKDLPARLIVTADPLPNGMYLAFWVCGKDFQARQNDVAVFFESIRIHMPEGDDYWQWQQWRGLKFKTPWGWVRYKSNNWANDYKGYERGTDREMTFGVQWSKTPYEKELEDLKKLNNVTELGGNTINGMPVMLYELASGPGQPFAATLLASVQVPLKSGGYIQISGSVSGGDQWGDARELIEEMMQSVTPQADSFDMSAAPVAAATPAAQATGAVPAQLPEPPPEATAANATPETAAPETQGNLPMASTPQPTEPVQTATGNPTPDSAPPETQGNLPLTATPEPTAQTTTPQTEPAVDVSAWQKSGFLGIVDILTPPDAQKEEQRKTKSGQDQSLRWVVGSKYNSSLILGAEMVVDPEAAAKDQHIEVSAKSETTLSGGQGKDRIAFHQLDGNISSRKDIPARMLVAAEPLPNGMYLVFYAQGKDFAARQKEVDAFFENIRISLPAGEDLWQAHEWKGFKFKTPWGWFTIPIQPAAVSYGAYECGTGRKMDFTIICDNIPFEKTLSTTERIFDVVNLGDKTINGLPVKLYELTRKPGEPFSARLLASVQAPLAAGGYAQIAISVFGGDAWGQARKQCEEILNNVSAEPGTFDLSKVPAATQTPGVNATPETAAPETQGNLPLPAATQTPSVNTTPETTATEPATPPEQTPAATVQAGAQYESSCKVKTLRGFYDKTGRGEEMRGDGSPEAVLDLKLKAPGRTIETMTIKSTQGQQAQWDTVPGNGHWLVVITEKGKALNNPDGSVIIKLGDSTRKFGLLIQDNNALASGKGAFVVQIQLDGGETLEIPVQQ